MPARMTISAITIISSMRVNPSNPRTDAPADRRTREPANHLPVTIFGSVERGRAALRVHVEHVVSAPRRGVRLVLVRPEAPFHAVGHRVDRNPPQVLELPAARVARVLELVDRRPDLAQVAAELRFALALRRHLRQRQYRRREDQQNRDDDDQLDEGVTFAELAVGSSPVHVATGRSPPGPQPPAAMRPRRPAPWPSP